jgi:hypothetical protein
VEILALFWIAGGIVFGGFCSFVAGAIGRGRWSAGLPVLRRGHLPGRGEVPEVCVRRCA